ncbi:MAG: hypothetical protein KGI06_02405 [Candidatus Micrarchaeota archaeon]|nr:hypothetical protein [Candidatus Micrarchaeota archaeon]
MRITASNDGTTKGKKLVYNVTVPVELATTINRKEPIELRVVRKDIKDLKKLVMSKDAQKYITNMKISEVNSSTFSRVKIREKTDAPSPISFKALLVCSNPAESFEDKLKDFIASQLRMGITSSEVSNMLRREKP